MSTMIRSMMLAVGVLGCGTDTSEPPAGTPCRDEPAFDPALTSSSATSLSHAAGQSCLGCHSEGGSARTAFLAAGTIYRSGDSRVVAQAGNTIHNVGETTLTVDACGNIYATTSFLNGALSASQPQADSFTMTISTNQPTKKMGGCNAAGCHDFTEAWGVHF